VKGNVLTHVCVAVYVPGVPQPGLPALTGVCVCGWSVCVAVHVPGVLQPGLPALTGVRVCVVCVCSCICTRCSAAWPTYTHRCVWSVCVCVWSVCVAVYVPGVPQPGLPTFTGVCVGGLCV